MKNIKLILQMFGCIIGVASCIWFIHCFHATACIEPKPHIKIPEIILATIGGIICLYSAFEFGKTAAFNKLNIK